MKFTIITLSHGGLSLAALCDEYQKRIQGYAKINCINLSPKKSKNVSIELMREHDKEAILKQIPKQSIVFLCDENGQQYSTSQFVTLLEKAFLSHSHVIFILGPAYGLSRSLLQQYPSLSLSAMTLQHEIAHLLLIEQLYRALTIMNNHPYHY